MACAAKELARVGAKEINPTSHPAEPAMGMEEGLRGSWPGGIRARFERRANAGGRARPARFADSPDAAKLVPVGGSSRFRTPWPTRSLDGGRRRKGSPGQVSAFYAESR